MSPVRAVRSEESPTGSPLSSAVGPACPAYESCYNPRTVQLQVLVLVVPRLGRELRLVRRPLGVPLLHKLDALSVDPPMCQHREEEAQHRRACGISVPELQPDMRTLEERRRSEQRNGAQV